MTKMLLHVAYCGTSTTWAVLDFLGSKLASQSSPQDAALKPPPTLSPVATPRAASPHQASGLPEKKALLHGSPGHPNALPAINPGSPRFAVVPPVATGLACGSVSTSQVFSSSHGVSVNCCAVSSLAPQHTCLILKHQLTNTRPKALCQLPQSAFSGCQGCRA